MTLEETINAKIEKALLDLEEQKKKKKKFKLPFGKKTSPSQAKKGYVTLIKINENNQIEFDKIKITDQSVLVDKIPRLSTPGSILYYKKCPCIIIPSWSVEPFSSVKHFNKTLEDGTNKKGFAILLERMQKVAIGEKKPIGNIIKILIGVALAALVGYAIFSGGF